jgi:XTP/dITP diphosphohydrolase
VIATHNPGKLAEMRDLLAIYGVDAISAGELGLPEPEEIGTTFAANARIKATAAAKAANMPAFADDSGIAVDTLDGQPGIYSARWAGPAKDFQAAMNKIHTMLLERDAKSAERRRAHFISALCGTVVWPPRGNLGFGYDPVFLPDGQTRTFGEMSAEEKHGLPPRGRGLSHRARAFLKLAEACLAKR